MLEWVFYPISFRTAFWYAWVQGIIRTEFLHRTGCRLAGASGRDVAADDGRESTMEGLAIFLGVFIRLLIPLVVLLLVGESVRRISHDPLIM